MGQESSVQGRRWLFSNHPLLAVSVLSTSFDKTGSSTDRKTELSCVPELKLSKYNKRLNGISPCKINLEYTGHWAFVLLKQCRAMI